MDKQWTTRGLFFIHKLLTGRLLLVSDVLVAIMFSKLLILLLLKKLCTGIFLLNNNNKIKFSNIY